MAALDQSKVEEILETYDSTGVTDHLYDMGKFLLDDCMKRLDQLDSKAITIVGYTGAIIALMVSTFSIWTSGVDRWAIVLVALGSIAGLLGAGLSLASFWPQELLMPSDSDWFEQDGFAKPDRLKKYYVSSLHLSISSYEKINAQKVSRIKRSQACLAIMVLFLLIVLGDATYRTLTRPASQPSSGHVGLAVSFDLLGHESPFSEWAAAQVLVSWESQRP